MVVLGRGSERERPLHRNKDKSADTVLPSQPRSSARRVWDFLTRPSQQVSDGEARDRARLLAGVTVTLTPVAIVLGLFSASVRPTNPTTAESILGAAIFTTAAVAYALSRTRWVSAAAWLFVLNGLVAPWATALVETQPHRIIGSAYFAVAAVLYSSFFLSFGATVVTSVVLVTLTALLPIVHPHIDADVMWIPIGLQTVLSTLILTGTHLRRSALLRVRHQAATLHAASERLERSHHNLGRLVGALPAGVAVVRQGVFVYVNPTLLASLGYTAPEEALGQRVAQVVHPADRAALEALFERPSLLAHTGGIDPPAAPSPLHNVFGAATELRLVRQSGETGDVEVTVVENFEFAGQPAHLLLCRDVTEQRRMQTQLMVSERMASLGTLAAGVGHEINNPLLYVMTNLSLLADQLREQAAGLPPDLAQEIEEAIDESLHGCGRIRDITRELRLFSNLEMAEPVAIDARAVLDSSIRLSAVQLSYHARIVRDYAEVPPVLAVESQLAQVFVNLLVNAGHAIAARAGNSGEVRVTTTLVDPANVAIDIRDNGAGMPPEIMRRIFDPFFTTKAANHGTGLGLAICLKVVRGLGGDIEVSSEEGRGSTFRVVLPVANDA